MSKANVQSVCKAEDRLNVVFLGGSITQGAGVSDYEQCWAAILTRELKGRFANVNCFNAGVGGTGSDYGLLRLYDDVIVRDPDVVFVEFAVNDQDKSKAEVQRCVEGIIRQLLEFRRTMKIIFLYATTKEFRACADIYREIADYYGIPSIDIQKEMRSMTELGEIGTEDFLTDGVHPNARGYRLYADFILERLDEKWEKVPTLCNIPFRSDYFSFVGKKVYPVEAECVGKWKKELVWDGEEIFSTDCLDSRMTFRFTGDVIGVVQRIGREYGKCVIELDGVRQKIGADQKEYLECEYETNCQQVMWYHNFECGKGEHRLKLFLSEENEKGKKLSVDFVYIQK